jgi:hypothetical protein
MQDLIVTVNKAELLEKIKANREQHRAIFEEAVEGYREAAIKVLNEATERLLSGKVIQVYFGLNKPKDHTGDYDNVIAMLEMHTDATLRIGQKEFAQYVRDDWEWKRHFLGTTAQYSSTARAQLEDDEE